ncbi:MAG: hypothetical protein HZA66_12060 [Rhodopseudomonas palustris]|uniref:Uncharacterized protein n=1 Tax=Rhodopseudomonas palustris TaxID=1076 RepID=A0A933RXD7_RHOPL|nr:hypothetical protein [Rhodopseudomonas palustris]
MTHSAREAKADCHCSLHFAWQMSLHLAKHGVDVNAKLISKAKAIPIVDIDGRIIEGTPRAKPHPSTRHESTTLAIIATPDRQSDVIVRESQRRNFRLQKAMQESGVARGLQAPELQTLTQSR